MYLASRMQVVTIVTQLVCFLSTDLSNSRLLC